MFANLTKGGDKLIKGNERQRLTKLSGFTY